MCRRAAKRQLQYVWNGWQQAAQHKAHVRQYLATSILRICHQATGTAFAQWKDFVQANIALREQQQQAVSHMQSVRLQQALLAWKVQVKHKQQLQVWFYPTCLCAYEANAQTCCQMSVLTTHSASVCFDSLDTVIFDQLTLFWSVHQLAVTIGIVCKLAGNNAQLWVNSLIHKFAVDVKPQCCAGSCSPTHAAVISGHSCHRLPSLETQAGRQNSSTQHFAASCQQAAGCALHPSICRLAKMGAAATSSEGSAAEGYCASAEAALL